MIIIHQIALLCCLLVPNHVFFAGRNLDEIPIVTADVSVQSSIMEMCQQAKVILNCVGPVS